MGLFDDFQLGMAGIDDAISNALGFHSTVALDEYKAQGGQIAPEREAEVRADYTGTLEQAAANTANQIGDAATGGLLKVWDGLNMGLKIGAAALVVVGGFWIYRRFK